MTDAITISGADWNEVVLKIPEQVLMSAAARISRARATSRPKVMRKCGECMEEFGTREFRDHMKTCNRRIAQAKPNRAAKITAT